MNAESKRQSGILLPLPCPETDLFRYAATRPVLNLLAETPKTTYSIRELHRATEYSLDNVRQAVTTLEAVNLVTITPDGNRKLVSINAKRVQHPEDPILKVPQREFHAPIQTAVDRLEEALDGVLGIVLFGSVADGTADRRSDVDLFVLVGSRQASNQQTAHEIATELGAQHFAGDRYEFQVLVESVETAGNYGERLQEILTQGIPLVETDTLAELREEVLQHG